MLATIKSILHRTRSLLKGNIECYLERVSGVIHVGANIGQERELYAKYGLPVIWIEPIPEVFETLKANIKDFPMQRAYNYLITDQDNKEYPFHISSHQGKSSSILDLNLHKDIWPHVLYVETIMLRSKTLATLVKEEQINLSKYNALIMDTQGSELLVLKGAASIVKNFKYIKTEVADFECYTDCCKLTDMNSFMAFHGFKEFWRNNFKEKENVGSCYNIVYRRKAW